MCSYDDAHTNKALLGGLVACRFLGSASSAAKDFAVDFDTYGPDRGGDGAFSVALVIDPLDLAPRFLKLLVEQREVARGGRARRMGVVMWVAMRRGRRRARICLGPV